MRHMHCSHDRQALYTRVINISIQRKCHLITREMRSNIFHKRKDHIQGSGLKEQIVKSVFPDGKISRKGVDENISVLNNKTRDRQ